MYAVSNPHFEWLTRLMEYLRPIAAFFIYILTEAAHFLNFCDAATKDGCTHIDKFIVDYWPYAPLILIALAVAFLVLKVNE
jgi:hypothetical protein